MKKVLFAALGFFACLGASHGKGKVSIDGSSTVYPITEAIAEEFRGAYPKIRVSIGVSGTGGGFKKFLSGETDINNASRVIKDKEMSKAKKLKVDYLEVPVAYDGVTVVINKKNTWAKNLTVEQLKMIWNTGSQVKKWSDIDSSWPDKKIVLFGPGPDSGTFDYFTKAINGKSGRCRPDYQKSEDDNVLVQGVKGNTYALGFFGYSYYHENKNQLNAVAIKSGSGDFVSPNMASIKSGAYKPLSRPIFIYLNKEKMKKAEVKKFVSFYLSNAKSIVKELGHVPLKDITYNQYIKTVSAL